MDVGLYAASTGLLSNLEAQDVIAHNLANINTAGFRRGLAVYHPFHAHLAAAGGELTGAELDGVALDYTPGPMMQTGRQLDLAIQGDGFFVLSGSSGDVYTRNGAFRFDAQRRIVDTVGRPLRSEGGELTVPEDALNIAVAQDGEVFADGTSVGRVRLVDVPTPRGFVRAPDGGLALPPGAPAPQPVESPQVEQGCLERSNVAAVDELVSMIMTLRSYEAAQRVLRSIDESYAQLNQAASRST